MKDNSNFCPLNAKLDAQLIDELTELFRQTSAAHTPEAEERLRSEGREVLKRLEKAKEALGMQACTATDFTEFCCQDQQNQE